ADGAAQWLARLLPSGGDVLITSRDDTRWSEQARLLAVGAFERAESIGYLQKQVPRLTREEAGRLADLLDNLPIAIALAAAWLTETGAPVEDYLDAVAKGELDVSTEEGQRRVDATWAPSLDHLRRRSPAAYRLLQLCAVTAPEISLDLIYSAAMAQQLEPYDPALSDPLMVAPLVSLLKRFALLQIDPQGLRTGPRAEPSDPGLGGHIVVHRLVQYAVRRKMSDEEIEDAQHNVHLVLTEAARTLGDVRVQKEWPRYRNLWPHVDATRAVTCVNPPVRQLLVDWVRYYYQRADPDRGMEVAQEAEAEWTSMLGTMPGDQRRQLQLQLLQLRFNRANVLRDKGAFTESLALDQDVLRQQEELLTPGHPHTLMTAGSLAADLRSLGHYAQALARDEQTCLAWSDFPEEYPLRLAALSNLAVSHRLMGHLAEALALDEQVYAARHRVLGPDDLYTLLSASSLGRDLREMGQFDRSVALLGEVVDRYTEVLGVQSRLAVSARVNLAVSLRSAGHPDEAAEILRATYEELTGLAGPDHPDTLACRLSRSVNLLEMESETSPPPRAGEPRAIDETQAILAAYQRRLGAKHPHSLICLSNLGAALRAEGDLALARARLQQALDDLREVLGARHPYALAAQINLAVVADEQHDYPEALAQTQSALTALQQVLGPDHPHTLRCEANLALIQYHHQGAEYQSSVELAIDRFARRVGANHPALQALHAGRLLRRIIDPHPF
ncbi:MAG TPA: FxSxx-COOH system tetratricopeptide repeat protein, partial [Rugosimonospora sp.]|nr:FxSxx-COOH system tetratricopeptide repeat protein [Rugosimonospora sp.]